MGLCELYYESDDDDGLKIMIMILARSHFYNNGWIPKKTSEIRTASLTKRRC